MIPVRIKGATHAYGKPEGWDEATRGPCRVLMVRMEHAVSGIEHVSEWKPTLEEAQALMDGGSILLTVCGVQPPVALHVQPAEVEDADPALS